MANWPTPTANDGKGSGPTLMRSDGKMRGDRLDYAAEQIWSTPRSSDGEKGGPNQAFGAGGVPLPAQAAQWTTPSAGDGQRGGTITAAMSGTSLAQQVNTLWYTPNVPNGVRTLAEETSATGMTKDGVKRQVGLENQANSFHRDHLTYPVGATLSHPRRSLNPLFVEWLMGWPPAWTLAV
ncbi:MAG: hypothetical protein ABTQ31_10095, partial [Rhizobiaceae bacterium]